MEKDTTGQDHGRPDSVAPQGKKTSRKTAVIYICIAVVIGLVVNIVMGLFMDGSRIWETVSKVSLSLILVPFLAYTAQSMVDALRLHLVARKAGHPVSLWTGVVNSMLGAFFSHITPLAMGGQPFQIYHLSRMGMPNKTATNIIVSRFVSNAMLLVGILLVGLPVILGVTVHVPALSVVFSLGLTVTVLFALFFLFLLIKPVVISTLGHKIGQTRLGRWIARTTKQENWEETLSKFMTGLQSEIRFLWSEGLHIMLADACLNMINLCLQTLALWYPLQVLTGSDITFLQVLVIYMAIWQVIFYIPSPGASGGIESMFTVVFSALTGKAELTLVAVVLWRFSTYYLSLIPGMFFAGMGFGKSKEKALD